MVQTGKIRYRGISNHTATEVDNSLATAPIAGTEDYYNFAGSDLDETGHSRVAVYAEEMIPRRTCRLSQQETD